MNPGPDDYAADTSTSGTLSVGGRVSGNIEQPYDQDWFKILLDAGTAYVFDLTGADGRGGTLGSGGNEARLSLYDAWGRLQDSATDNGIGGDPSISFTPTAGGTYFLGVSDLFDGTGNYTLAARAAPGGDDYAADTGTSGTLNVGGQVTGTLEQPNDQDWFRILLQAGTTYVFDLTGADGHGGTLGSGSNEARLTLYDASGSITDSATDNGFGGDPRIWFTPTVSGAYFLGVSDFFNGTGTYTLAAKAAPGADDYAASTSTTGTLSVGGQATGALERPGDQDWFKVLLQAGTSYVFDLTGADGGGGTLGAGSNEARLSLYDASGAIRDSAIDNGIGGDPRISFTPDVSGAYFLGVSDFFNGTGTYTLVARAIAGSDDYAASTTTTGTLAVGGQATGTLEQPGDQDWFQVLLQAGTAYVFDLTGADGGGGTLGAGGNEARLSLYDASGSIRASATDYGIGGDPSISFTPTVSGPWFLGVSDVFDGTGTYTLVSRAVTDVSAPAMQASSPADDAVGVPVATNIVVTFTEAIQRGTGTIVLKTAGGAIVEAYDAASSPNLGISGATLTIDPGADLAYGTGYRLEFGAGAVKDLAGNGCAASSSYNFTTVAAGATQGTVGDDTLVGTNGNDRIDGVRGNDTIDGQAGTDTAVVGTSVSNVQSYSLDDGRATLTTDLGSVTLQNIERVRFSDALFALDTKPGGHVWEAAALFHAQFGTLPGIADLSRWTAQADRSGSLAELAQSMLDAYTPGVSSRDLVSNLHLQLLHQPGSPDAIQGYVDQIGPGKTFATHADLLAWAAGLSVNTDDVASIVGTAQPLDPNAF